MRGHQQWCHGHHVPPSHAAGRQQSSKVTICFREHVLFREQPAYTCVSASAADSLGGLFTLSQEKQYNIFSPLDLSYSSLLKINNGLKLKQFRQMNRFVETLLADNNF